MPLGLRDGDPEQLSSLARSSSLQAGVAETRWKAVSMTDQDLPSLRARAAAGDHDAVDELVELASERGDLDELRRLADGGSTDAVDELVELASERGDLDELRRLADRGSRDAADVLA